MESERVVASGKRLSVPPSSIFHSFTVLSDDAEASVLPHGVNTAESTPPVCPVSVRCSPPVTFQILIVMSNPPEAMYLPSGENFTVFTEAVWLEKVLLILRSPLLWTFQSITLLSLEPDTSWVPSGLKSSDVKILVMGYVHFGVRATIS